ncbi:VOC family protein [Numidum massiliense]|uniref:VOC family protein n=1 Tax=Numidum massiliense TaxID=1522315 RepID=UPI001E5BAD54|nr:VOC family protein [Numidum massiliense]
MSELHVNEQCVLYFADIFQNNITKGNHIQLTLDLEDDAEITRLYASLAKDGEVKMELQDTFWNAKYGIVTDPYGVTWELNFSKQSHK